MSILHLPSPSIVSAAEKITHIKSVTEIMIESQRVSKHKHTHTGREMYHRRVSSLEKFFLDLLNETERLLLTVHTSYVSNIRNKRDIVDSKETCHICL